MICHNGQQPSLLNCLIQKGFNLIKFILILIALCFSIENHNSTLYALFQLTCRNDRFDLSPIWKSKFDEIEKHCVVLPDLLDECRDIKLLESLKLMQSSPDDVKLPESFDKGIASTFLLAGWRQPQRDFDKKIFDSLFSRMQKITLERVSELREKKSFQVIIIIRLH